MELKTNGEEATLYKFLGISEERIHELAYLCREPIGRTIVKGILSDEETFNLNSVLKEVVGIASTLEEVVFICLTLQSSVQHISDDIIAKSKRPTDALLRHVMEVIADSVEKGKEEAAHERQQEETQDEKLS